MTQPFGGMELLGRLSAGGMGEVLLARRRGAHGFEKLIAVKTIRGDLVRREDIRRMFLDEARLMARLDHPAIAQVYDFGEENQVLYLAMEYVPGIVLSKLMKTRLTGLPASVAARIAIEVCRGLHAAHELADAEGESLGVVHRDVSPHNLMVTFDGKVKILDFGIALRKGREAPETELGVVKGKATYVAPEQLAQHKIDRRSDIYSVAVVLHEMLTAKRLFSGTGNPIVDADERKNIPAPSKIVTTIPPALDHIVLKGLELDPAKRYTNAREMALALERCVELIGGETVEEFASRELAIERASHRARLAAITGASPKEGTVPTEKSIPPISVASADIIPIEPSVVASPTPASRSSSSSSSARNAPPTVEDRARSSRPPTLPPVAAKKSNAVWLVLLGAAAVAALVAISARESRAPSEPREPKIVELLPVIQTPIEPVAPANTATSASTASIAGAPPTANTATLAAALIAPAEPAQTATRAARADEGEDDVAETEETIDEAPPIPAPVVAAVAAKTKTKAPAKRPAPKAPPRQAFGYVTVEAEPNAVVVIDGKTAGYTPLRNLKLAAGKHEVQLRKPYSRALRMRRTVWVGENKRVKISSRERTTQR